MPRDSSPTDNQIAKSLFNKLRSDPARYDLVMERLRDLLSIGPDQDVEQTVLGLIGGAGSATSADLLMEIKAAIGFAGQS